MCRALFCIVPCDFSMISFSYWGLHLFPPSSDLGTAYQRPVCMWERCRTKLLLRPVWMALMAEAPKDSGNRPCWGVMQTAPCTLQAVARGLLSQLRGSWEWFSMIPGTRIWRANLQTCWSKSQPCQSSSICAHEEKHFMSIPCGDGTIITVNSNYFTCARL